MVHILVTWELHQTIGLRLSKQNPKKPTKSETNVRVWKKSPHNFLLCFRKPPRFELEGFFYVLFLNPRFFFSSFRISSARGRVMSYGLSGALSERKFFSWTMNGPNLPMLAVMSSPVS